MHNYFCGYRRLYPADKMALVRSWSLICHLFPVIRLYDVKGTDLRLLPNWTVY